MTESIRKKMKMPAIHQLGITTRALHLDQMAHPKPLRFARIIFPGFLPKISLATGEEVLALFVPIDWQVPPTALETGRFQLSLKLE